MLFIYVILLFIYNKMGTVIHNNNIFAVSLIIIALHCTAAHVREISIQAHCGDLLELRQ